MAIATLTSTPNIITLCESITGFTGDTFSLEPDIKVQGGNSVSCAMTNNGANIIEYATSFAAVNQHIRLWVNLAFVGNILNEASNGIQISVVSGSGTALYTVGGSDTYAGGWVQFVIYTGNTPTSGSVPSGTCTSVGLRINTGSKPRNQPANCWVDAWYYGDGFTVTGGTFGDEIDWSHIASVDATNAYGVVSRQDDIYFLAGDVKIGNGATTTFFKSGQKVQYKDLPVSTTLYGVTFQGSGCNVDISGGAWGAAGLQNYFLDCDDAGLSVCNITGVQFAKSNNVKFKIGQTITNTVFDSCGLIEQNGATMNSITISNGTGAVHTSVTNFALFTNINLISGGTGFGIQVVEGIGNISMTNVSSTNYGANTTLNATLNYTGTTLITLAYSGGTEPTVAGLVTVLQNQNSLTLNNLKNPTKIYLINTDLPETDVNFILDSVLVTTGTYTYSFTQGANINALYRLISLAYKTIEQDVILGNIDLTIPVSQQIDREYENS